MTARDKEHVEEIIKHLKRVEDDYRIDLTSEMEWLRGVVKEEPVSENLEESASFYSWAITKQIDFIKSEINDDIELTREDVKYAFINGADWQKQQMMKDAHTYFVLHDYDSHGADYGLGIIHIGNNVLEPIGIKPDDKVKVLIIKED